MKHALVIANSPDDDWHSQSSSVDNATIVVALDGAYLTARKKGLNVDVLLGDLDSISQEDINQIDSTHTQILENKNQNTTDLDKAIEYLKKSLAIDLKIHGDKHPSTGLSYNNLGSVWSNIGEYDKAIKSHEKSLAINLEVHGDEHPSIGKSYNNLGNCHRDKKQYTIAKKYYKKSYNIFLSKLGEEHQHTKLLAKKLKEINDQ